MPNSAAPRDHAAIAHKYAQDVTAGKVPAGGWVRKAAKRHLTDLKRPKASFPYRFKPEAGAKVCEFIELLPHTKGKWAAGGELIELQPWQCFIVVVLFGWFRNSNGTRRFREAYLCIPRKNGKSLLAAGIAAYMAFADGEYGAEVYTGATTEHQAWEVFRPARQMMMRAEGMRDALGVEVLAKALVRESDASKLEPMIGNPGDGQSPSCAVIDEFHEHDTPAQYDTMQTGMGARSQPLMLAITTAGYNIAGPCHEKQDEVQKVLDGVIANEELFGCIFGIDPEDDWADPKVLIKANPNYGVSVDAEFLQSQQRQAMANPVQQNKFKTKHLNVWCSVLGAWMNMQQWMLAGDATQMVDEDDLIDAGADCIFGIDLASKSDLCSEQRLYWRTVNGKVHFYLFGRYWLPEAAVEDPGPNHAHYVKWREQGLLTQTDGATVDFEAITDQVIEDCKKSNPRELAYDPFNATQMAQKLMENGIECVEFQQTPQNFAVPMDEFTAAVKDARFHHDGNQMTTWCVSNVVARPTRKGLFAPMKAKQTQKIDGAVAALIAMARATALGESAVNLEIIRL